MSWRYREPVRSDFDTDEEYEAELATYESALDDYCDNRFERERAVVTAHRDGRIRSDAVWVNR